ncbi:protein MODIFYING WALL LIGNIN-1 [Lactuca sativa]|uniref:Uncharacterized protein n=1 Tax=Lactuca sativa TaxID=4236 RepID=A0A9R1X8P4_LACSA|nr:protein MODIFYING WALL LIGNIN-1 [Lactuca sativa]KAJ0199712.1 hypothetical protein LSAT_V11C600303140 [Lactuca sativa]
MDSKVAVHCAIAAVLGIIAAATGFAGEATRVKVSEVFMVLDSCVYPNSPALALGIVSAVFTIITRIYISVWFGGSGCCRSDPNSTAITKLLFVLSWVASVIAMILLLTAAALNNRQVGQIDSYGYITCYVVKPGIFAAGAILALLSAVFGICAYLTISSVTQAATGLTGPLPVGAGVDLEKFPQQYTPQQQYPPRQQYPPQK